MMEAASEDDQVERESGDEDEGNDEEEIDVEDERPARKSWQARTRKKFFTYDKLRGEPSIASAMQG